MANTKKLSPEKRKATKRIARRELKKIFGTLNRKQRAKLREEPQGIKKFVAAQQEKAEKAAQQEKAEKVEKAKKVEKVEKVEEAEKVKETEKVEKAEKAEKAE